MAKLRVAVVGCGAVAGAHLPILDESDRVETSVLVDKSIDRARELGKQFGVREAVEDYREIVGRADVAILALPHHLHAQAAIDLLGEGLHVLVEKPMAMTTAECDAMIAASERADRRLAVGLLSRYLAVAPLVRRLLVSGALGNIRSFTIREGSEYDWPVASDFMFRRDMGGGVLMDTGAHVLDVLLLWLGDAASVEYFDDAHGGADANCELRLKMQSGAEGTVEMSRTRDLGNSWILRGELGTLEVERKFGANLTWNLAGDGRKLVGGLVRADDTDEDPLDCFRLQLTDFLDAIDAGQAPPADGREGRRAVALMEACRAARRPLELPWEVPAGPAT